MQRLANEELEITKQDVLRQCKDPWAPNHLLNRPITDYASREAIGLATKANNYPPANIPLLELNAYQAKRQTL